MKFTLKDAYGDAEGPLGLPMPSERAKEVEKLLKDLNADCKEMLKDGICRRAAAAKVDPDLEARTEKSFITTESVDRDFKVMIAKGMDFKQFKKNPVVTFAHNYRALPVGRSQWVIREKVKEIDGHLAKTEYPERPKDLEGEWVPDAVWHMVSKGFLPGKSIGFIPTEVSSPDEKEIVARPELAKVSRVIRKCIILEYAIAPVQSNPDAILQTVGKGVAIPEFILDECGIYMPTSPFFKHAPKGKTEPAPEPKPVDEKKLQADMASSALKSLQAISLDDIAKESKDKFMGRV